MAENVILGEHEPDTVAQLERCVAAVEGARGALMPDGHLGYSQPIGGVVAYPDHISPSGVGYDIACGNKAVCTNLRVEDVVGAGGLSRFPALLENSGDPGGSKNEASEHAYSRPKSALARIMDEIVDRISFGMGRSNKEPVADDPVLDAIREANFAPQRQLLDLAAKQLGTVGAGNHYVDLFADADSRVWVGVHFGSRGFGHKTASGFLSLAAGGKFEDRGPDGEMKSPPVLLDTQTTLGESYLAAMELAGQYAYAGRDWVCSKVLDILGAESTYEVHNHHNFAWRETHFGQAFWVVRKGATPAFPGQRGFVGATMAEDAVILEGRDSDVSPGALYSTVHGAGRAMSRTQAGGKVKRRKIWLCTVRDCPTVLEGVQGRPACPTHPDASLTKSWRTEVKSKGLIDWPLVQAEISKQGIELRGGAADEAPGAYKRLDTVLEAAGDTVEVIHRLRPLGVAMAGADTFDPFKD